MPSLTTGAGPSMSVAALALSEPDRTAVVAVSRRITWAELARLVSDRTASLLQPASGRRFEASPLNGLIPWLFISEELGASKPDSAFFAPVLRTLGNPDPRRVLMVGDNLLADIQGGIQAGLDTAWYNPGRLPGDPAIVPTWEVDGYAALQALILKEEKNNI